MLFRSNRFQASFDDGFIYSYVIEDNVDTSAPLSLYIIFYGEGAVNGDIYTEFEILKAGVDFIYGQNPTSIILPEVIPILGADQNKRTIGVDNIDISSYKTGDTLIVAVNRNGTNVLDTYTGDIVMENSILVGTKWKL